VLIESEAVGKQRRRGMRRSEFSQICSSFPAMPSGMHPVGFSCGLPSKIHLGGMSYRCFEQQINEPVRIARRTPNDKLALAGIHRASRARTSHSTDSSSCRRGSDPRASRSVLAPQEPPLGY